MTKWAGLGINIFSVGDNPDPWELSPSFGDWIDDLLANGFTTIRLGAVTGYAPALVIQKTAVAIAVNKGMNVTWGFNKYPPLTAANWAAHRQVVLDGAQWAQDNGVYEFSIGNEEEMHNDDTTVTDAQVRDYMRSLATDVKAIFTRGNVVYSTAVNGYWELPWIAEGKGDIDLIGMNIYMNGDQKGFTDNWKTYLTNMVNKFGVDGTYITEFSPSYISLNDYSTDEVVQAQAVTEMIDYIKASGVKRAFYFCYYDDSRPFGPQGFGALKTDKIYRLLWNSLLNSN